MSSIKRLNIVFQNCVYEWFELSQFAIESITLELFQQRILDFLSVPIKEQMLRDLDGALLSTTDLKRSLRSVEPLIWIDSTCTETICKSPEPHPDPTVLVTLERNTSSVLGFSNVVSGSHLMISRIDFNGLLHMTAGNRVKEGDMIISVNSEKFPTQMRKELFVSSTVKLRILTL